MQRRSDGCPLWRAMCLDVCCTGSAALQREFDSDLCFFAGMRKGEGNEFRLKGRNRLHLYLDATQQVAQVLGSAMLDLFLPSTLSAERKFP